MSDKCLLCGAKADLYYQEIKLKYWRCPQCALIFAPESQHLSHEEEKKRYLFHQESESDLGYQNYLSSFLNVLQTEAKGLGLDYGCGRKAVVSLWAQKFGLVIDLYDPFFHPKELKENHYDFIYACEVVEHFHHPLREFQQIKQSLKEGGKFFIQTQVYPEDKNLFAKWYYRLDPTHVCFYHAKTYFYLSQIFQWEFKLISPSVVFFH